MWLHSLALIHPSPRAQHSGRPQVIIYFALSGTRDRGHGAFPNLGTDYSNSVPFKQKTIMGVHLQPTLYTKTSKGADNSISSAVAHNLGSDIMSALYVLSELDLTGRDSDWIGGRERWSRANG